MKDVSRGTSNPSEAPIRFAGSELGAQRHVCAFFHTPDEEYRVLLPFVKEGFERGEKAFHVVDPELREAHLRRVHHRSHAHAPDDHHWRHSAGKPVFCAARGVLARAAAARCYPARLDAAVI